MTLSIKDRETDALARTLADLTGQSITEAVRDALRTRLEEQRRARGGLAGRLRAISERSGAALRGAGHSLDHDALLYDEAAGLPR